MSGEYYRELLAWEQKTAAEYPNCRYVVHWHGERITDFREAWDTSLMKLGLKNIKYKCRDCKMTTERNPGMQRAKMVCSHCGSKRLRRDDQIYHDLRRTAVRNMIDAGVPEKDAMYISGHKTTAMLHRYRIVNRQNLEAAADKVTVYLRKLEELRRNKT